MSSLARFRDALKSISNSFTPYPTGVNASLWGEILNYSDNIARSVGTKTAPTYVGVSLIERVYDALKQSAVNLGQTVDPANSQEERVVNAVKGLITGLGFNYRTDGAVSQIERCIRITKDVTDAIKIFDEGEPLDYTNGSGAGLRQSMMVGGSGVTEVGMPDTLTQNGLEIIGVSDGATNLVDTAPNSGGWTVGSNTDITPNGDGSFRIEMPNLSGTFIYFPVTFDNSDYTMAFDYRQTPGGASSNLFKVQSRDAGLVQEFYSGSPPTEWTSIVSTKDNNSAALNLYILDEGGVDIEIRNIRFHNSAVAHPAHVDGTGAGNTYGTDDIQSALTSSEGTIVHIGSSYGWTGYANNPVNAEPRLYSATDLDVYGSGTNTVFNGISVAGSPTEYEFFLTTFDWNGVTQGARFNDSARSTQAAATTPSGTFYLGNRAAVDRTFHGVESIREYTYVLTDTQWDLLRRLLLAKLDSIETLFLIDDEGNYLVDDEGNFLTA